MSWQEFKDAVIELFHQLGLSNLYQHDPGLQPIPIKRTDSEQ